MDQNEHVGGQLERRVFERFSARFPAKFKDTRDDFGTNVFLRDVSASGAHLIVRERLYLDDHAEIEVELPDGNCPMVLGGRVVWSKPANSAMWDIGVKFSQVNLFKMSRLFKFALQD